MTESISDTTNVDLKLLRTYQIEGVDWLVKNQRGIIADDMGLGKTLQVIKALQILMEKDLVKSVLIVCPLSLIQNWEDELKKWAPEITFSRFLSNSTNMEIIKSASNSDVLITNYENLRSGTDLLQEIGFDILVADEVHKVRKFTSQISKSFMQLKTPRFWAMTGTPIENNIEDILNLSEFVAPGLFSAEDKKRSPLIIKEEIRPYILRRIKSQVLHELPEVIEKDIPVKLTNLQLDEYKKLLNSRQKIIEKKGSHFSVLTQMRAVCDGGENFDENAKVLRAAELIENILLKNEKVIVFSYYVTPLKSLEQLLQTRKISFTTILGEDNVEEREENIKNFKNLDIDILLASSRVASEGLNLTEANNVIFLNRWWNPSSNNQARDRVNRLGQKKIVYIYNLYCIDTVEQRLLEILESKNELYEKMVNGLIDNIDSLPLDLILDE
jgi:SNF2 family DNA or RNA helicase